VNNELERIWKDAIIAKFEVISWRLPGGAVESYKKRELTIATYQREI
jgi:hypothetical protein